MAEPPNCPDDDQLRALLQGGLAEPTQTNLCAHLEGCGVCQKRLEALVASSSFWSQAVHHLAKAPASAPPDLTQMASPFATPPSEVGPAGRAGEGLPAWVGDYQILAELGRGGMGVVYKARQATLNRVVALKMLLAGGHAGPEDRLRFLAEAERMAALQHPGVVQILDFGTHEDLPYFALEFCPGGSLADRLGQALPTPGEAARIVEQVARAVQAAHEHGIIHRDLKPGNILFAADGQPRVTDFGLARKVEAGSGITPTGAVMGTPSYMAPEQAEGRKNVGPLADVWALGAILYECLTAFPPFRGMTAYEALIQTLAQEPIAPSRLHGGLPRDLETICLKCLQKEPGRRYASAAALAEDLGRWQKGEPIVARRVGAAERALKWARKHPAVATLLAAIVAGVILAFLALHAEQLRTEEQRDQAVMNLELARKAEREARDNLEQAQRAEREARANLNLARRAEREATANFEQAQRAVDDCFGLAREDPLLQAENLRKVRLLLLGKTLPFYEGFLARKPADESLEVRQAEYLGRVAYIIAELGRSGEALKPYEQARQIHARLARAHPEVARHRVDLARTWNFLGNLQRETGKPREALKSFEQARDIRLRLSQANPEIPEHQADLANTWNSLGVLQYQTGKPREALKSFEHARDVRLRLSKAHPEVTQYQAALARTWNNLGVFQWQTGKPREALQSYEHARDIHLGLSQARPEVTEHQADLADTWNNLGVLQRRTGKPQEALMSHEHARDIRLRLTKAHPEDTRHQSALARTWNNLGVLQNETGKPQEALKSHEHARDIRLRLTKAHPEIPEHQADLANTWNSLGVLQGQTGKPQEALMSFEQAREILHRLSQAHPEVPEHQADLARTYVHLANLKLQAGKADDALESVARAIPLLVGVRRGQPQHPTYRLYLSKAHSARAEVLARLGRHRDAVADWDEVLRLNATPADTLSARLSRSDALARAGEHHRAVAEAEDLALAKALPGESLYQLAGVLSLSSAAAARDGTRPLPQREKQAEAWARRAVELLRRAEQAGHFRDAGAIQRLEKDADFAYLRPRADFTSFVKELEQKTKATKK